MNTFTLQGRITRDIEITQTQNGKDMTKFSLAVPKVKNSKEVDFFNFVAYDKNAQLLGQWFKKGSMLGTNGYVETWKNKDNQTQYTFIVERITFPQASKPKEDGEYMNTYNTNKSEPKLKVNEAVAWED